MSWTRGDTRPGRDTPICLYMSRMNYNIGNKITMSLEEPTMLGATPEERVRDQRRTKRIQRVAAVVVFIIAVGIGISLLPTTPSKNVYVNTYDSVCNGGANFSCTVVLDARQGTVTASDIRSVLINGTNPTESIKTTGDSVTIHATLPSINMIDNQNDTLTTSLRPPTVGSVVVYLSDGTTVSGLLGAAGIVGNGPGA